MLLGRDPNLDDLLALRFGVSHSRLLGFSHGHRAERARFQRVRYGRWLRGVLGGGSPLTQLTEAQTSEASQRALCVCWLMSVESSTGGG